jgi:hypothetical protein
MMMENKKSVYIFREGSSTFENTAGNAEYNSNAGMGNGRIYLRSNQGTVAGGGNPFEHYGKFKIPVDFTNYKKLCIEAKGSLNGRVAVGYGKAFNISLDYVTLPTNYAFVSKGGDKAVYALDISATDGVQFICASVTELGVNGFDVAEIYNIWLE